MKTKTNIENLLSDFKKSINEYNDLKSKIDLLNDFISKEKPKLKEELLKFNIKNGSELESKISELDKIILNDIDFLILRAKYDDLVKEQNKLFGEMNTYNTLKKERENKIIELKKRLEKVEKMIGFVINLNETIKVKTIGYVEEVVTKSLNQIFKVNSFKFKISFDTHGTTPVSNFYLIENDVEKDVINSFGGGVADIVGIVLRLVLLELQYPKNTAPVILDETGKFISNDYQASFSDFLKNWSTTFKRQIIIISHKTEVMGFSDRIIEIKKDIHSFPIIKK